MRVCVVPRRWLTRLGRSINHARKDDKTPLYIAFAQAKEECAKQLLRLGGDLSKVPANLRPDWLLDYLKTLKCVGVQPQPPTPQPTIHPPRPPHRHCFTPMTSRPSNVSVCNRNQQPPHPPLHPSTHPSNASVCNHNHPHPTPSVLFADDWVALHSSCAVSRHHPPGDEEVQAR